MPRLVVAAREEFIREKEVWRVIVKNDPMTDHAISE